MATREENFMHWLRDAHAMEHQSVESTEKQLTRLEHYPQLRAWVQEHVESSRRQEERLRQCIERRGGDTSTLKQMAAKLMGNVQAVTGFFASDEVMKNVITDYAYKYYEIANYRCLIETADQIGDAETKRMLEQNLREEEELANRLAPLLPEMTRQYLQRDESALAAKR